MDVLTINEHEYELVFSPSQVKDFLENLHKEEFWALDFETTALYPQIGRVRLTSISNGKKSYLLDHDNCGSFKSMAARMIGPTYIVFNSGFEYKWFDHEVPEAVELWDVQFMRKAKMGGMGGLSLARMVKMDLGIELAKDEQASDWANPRLTQSQLDYGAYDAYITWKLAEHWKDQMTDGHWNGFHVFNDAARGNIEMEETGLYLDTGIHARNIRVWKVKRDTAKRYFERFTPPSIIKNINSRPQMSDFLKRELHPDMVKDWPKTDSGKHLSLDRDTLKLAAHWLPYPMNRWLIAYLIYHYWAKYTSTYGDTLITKQNMAGKVTYRLNMAAAATGRYSSSSINIQNIPRKPYIRRAFCVNPRRGEMMVLADYSGIEVRVLAEVSGDEQLKEDCIYGNVHGEGAALINKIPSAEFMEVLDDKTAKDYYKFKELRNRAKVFTFRLTYGAGIGALSVSLKRGVAETRAALDAWATRYPKAYNYRFNMQEHMNYDGFIPIVDGRTVYVSKHDRSLPVAANYPIQGAAASVMYRAVYHVRNNYVEGQLDAVLAASVHDELLSYSDKDCADLAHRAKMRGMEQGWLDIFPDTSIDNLIESAVGTAWSDKP